MDEPELATAALYYADDVAVVARALHSRHELFCRFLCYQHRHYRWLHIWVRSIFYDIIKYLHYNIYYATFTPVIAIIDGVRFIAIDSPMTFIN